MDRLKVDVIIPTHKPEEKFYNLIQMLKKQTYPVSRILIINTEKKRFPSYRYEGDQEIEIYHIRKEDFDHGGTRDKAASMCDGDILLFMTQDAVPSDIYLVEELLKPFKREDVAAAYARQLPAQDCSLMERYTRAFNYGPMSRRKKKSDLSKLGIKTYFCSNVCAAYRRDVYKKMGGFEKKTIFNEDMIFAGKLIQAGYSVAYVAEAKVIHSHNYTNRELFQRNFDLAVSQVDHPEIFGRVKSEKEGIRLVRQTVGYFWHMHKPWLIPDLMIKSAYKYMGYRKGRKYKKLSKKKILKYTMNPSYWTKK